MNIFELFGMIAINNKDANKAISETGKKADHLAATVGKAFDKVGKLAINCGKVMAKGLAVGTAAMSALVGSSIKEFGEYEQLVGGVETLFKDSADTVMKYAKNAYKTAGLSANDYMSTVTSFSARLLQGLGGNTEAAAKIADLAITDMSDNANKMGTNISSIQDAYNGFAKQNYTMLDNLKLGYGGTATEMARLINDSGVLGDTMKVTERTVNDVSFDKMIEAIHVIQTEMGITGTTAKEASETITGSWSASKAAFKNFLTGAGSAKDLASALTVTAKNVTKNLKNLLPHLVEGINELLFSLTPELPGLLESLLPGVVDGAGKLLGGIAKALPSLAKVVVDKIPEILRGMKTALVQTLPELVKTVFSISPDRIREILGELGGMVASIWTTGVWPTIQNLFKITLGIDLPRWPKAVEIRAWWDNSGLGRYTKEKAENISAFFTDIGNAIKFLWDQISLFTKDDTNGETGGWVEKMGLGLLEAKLNTMTFGLWGLITNWKTLTEWVSSTAEAVGNFFSISIPQAWKDMCTAVGDWWTKHITEPIQAAIAALERFLGLEGTEGSHVPGITGTGGNSAGLARSQYQGKGSKRTVFGTSVEATNYVPGFAKGLDFVPYDNFPAYLHYGETVLTRKDADAWRKGSTGNMALLAAKFDQMQETLVQVLEGVRNTPIAVNIDSKAAAVLMAREMTKSIGNRNIQTLMGMGG